MAKDLLFRFRLTSDESEMLDRLATREGMSRSAFVRKLVRDRYRRLASASQVGEAKSSREPLRR